MIVCSAEWDRCSVLQKEASGSREDRLHPGFSSRKRHCFSVWAGPHHSTADRLSCSQVCLSRGANCIQQLTLENLIKLEIMIILTPGFELFFWISWLLTVKYIFLTFFWHNFFFSNAGMITGPAPISFIKSFWYKKKWWMNIPKVV